MINNYTCFDIVNNIVNFTFTLIIKKFFVIIAEWKIQFFIKIYVRTNNDSQNKITFNKSTNLHEIHIYMNADCIKNIKIKLVKSNKFFFLFSTRIFFARKCEQKFDISIYREIWFDDGSQTNFFFHLMEFFFIRISKFYTILSWIHFFAYYYW